MIKATENVKIALSVTMAFIITFSLLVVFLNQYSYTNTFYSQHFDPKIKKVFLVGSSYVGFLNTTLINEDISQEHQDYAVYNLAYGDDQPKTRLTTINEIISAKPQIVFYGISYRDFATFGKPSPLPDPHQSFVQLATYENLGNNIHEFPNPIRATVSAFQDALSRVGLQIATSNVFEPNTPFFSYPPGSSTIQTDKEMRKLLPSYGLDTMYLAPASENHELLSLKTIIDDLKKNNIKVIIFATPVSRVYLDGLSDIQKETFDSILENLSSESGVKIYNLTDKYADLPIWHELGHVAYNKDSSIYSKDVAKIISDEMGS